jgi:extracellular factor (EF) 3-hydroxypalmitic acid methyl ester biosynthesis protein
MQRGGGTNLRTRMTTVVRDKKHRGPMGPCHINLSPAGAEALAGRGLPAFLDHIAERLSGSDGDQDAVSGAIEDLILGMREQKTNSGAAEWEQVVRTCRQHPLLQLVHEDPFTRRAYSKPRGYAGDAELIDYIYGREEHWPVPETTPLGRNIFNCTTLEPAPEGVRARRGFVADVLDRLAAENRGLQVLSVAAGHLREADLSSAVRRRKVGRFVALDNDHESLREVERSYARLDVETIHAGIRTLLTRHLNVGLFDFVYSTGLFDYLQQAIARRLVTNLFELLNPGGRLLVANFLPGIRDVGYMEAFMDWKLIYRTRMEMIDLTTEIPESDIRHIRLSAEENRNIVFLEIRRN